MRNLEEFNNKFKNQTAFIIAAGPSVNDQNLTLLKNKLVFSVNSGYIACPNSAFFITDDSGVIDWSYFYQDLYNQTWTIPLLYEGKVQNIFGDRTVFFKHRKGKHLTNEYSHSNYDYHLMEATTSVGTAIHSAYIMGCSPIVLLGVDCSLRNGYKYFWQENKKYPKPTCKRNIRVRNEDKLSNPVIEPTLADIKEYWKETSIYWKDIEIYTTSEFNIFPQKSIKYFLR